MLMFVLFGNTCITRKSLAIYGKAYAQHIFCFLLHFAQLAGIEGLLVRDSHQQSHCVVSSSKTLYPPHSTGLTQ